MQKTLYINELSSYFKENSIIQSKTRMPVTIQELLSDLEDVRVIYVGEQHTISSHHSIQLEIIKRLVERGAHVSIGMEMFSKEYQHVLNQWSNGELEKDMFLKKTHWYTNWKYSFNLYEEILTYAKDNHLEIVALNMPFHIPSKIAIGGIENLLDEEKKYLPQDIDTSISAHKDYLKKIYESHNVKGMDAFENFYAAQCVWEDKMAETIAAHLGEKRMVVLIGNGHIIYKFGVPNRAFKRTEAHFRTLYLTPPGKEAKLEFADYLWVTPDK